VLVVGASGQVGTQFLSHFASLTGPESVLPAARLPANPGWLELDLGTLNASEIKKKLQGVDLSAIYVVAGMTNADACESQPDLAFRTNSHGPALLAKYASDLGLPLVYFSTEYVFDGATERPGPYREDDLPNPQNVYGASKLAGEKAVLAAHEGALIIRTTVVYGEDPQGKNYLYTVLRQLAAGLPLRVPQDQISTPTFNRDLIRAAVGLMDANATGIFHVCGPELFGRLDFAQRIAAHFQLDPALLQGKDTWELQQRASRPLAAGLATDKLSSLFPNLMPRDLATCLAACTTNLDPFVRSILHRS
jgi:dTDP-4-dehydrorhamnose reductase